MSDAIGLVAVLPADGRGPPLLGTSETSEATQQLVDDEVRRLIDAAYRSGRRLNVLGEVAVRGRRVLLAVYDART
jgi:ATP-dependent Zn protease